MNVIVKLYPKNKELYEEIHNLLGLYAHIKKNTTYQPYIIIGKN